MPDALDRVYATLDAPTRSAYRRIGLVPGPDPDLTVPLVAAALGAGDEGSIADEAGAENLLEALVDATLLKHIDPGRYAFHDHQVRQDAEDRARREEGTGQREMVLRRVMDWCLDRATAAEALLTPQHRFMSRNYVYPPAAPASFDTDDGALGWLAEHQDTLMDVLRAAEQAAWDVACWQLVDAMWPLWLRLRPLDAWTEAHEIGAEAARRCGDREAEMWMLISGGKGLRMAGRLETAEGWLNTALDLAQQQRTIEGEAQALSALGSCRMAAGRWGDAGDFYGRARDLRQILVARQNIARHRRQLALTDIRLGEVGAAQGEWPTAIAAFQCAYEALDAVGDRYDAARARARLGHTLTISDSDSRAGEQHLAAAVEAFREAGSLYWEGLALEMLGDAALRCADTARARGLFEQAERALVEHPRDVQRVRRRLLLLPG